MGGRGLGGGGLAVAGPGWNASSQTVVRVVSFRYG